MLKLLQRAMQHQQQVPQQQQQQQAQQQAQLQVFRGQLLFSSVAAGSGERPAKPAEAAANAHTPTDIAQLRQLVGSLWPQASSDPAVRAKRLMADMLLAQPNLALPTGAVGRLGQLLGSAKSLGISGFNELLARDPSGCFVFENAEVPPMIRLDPAALRQYAHKQGASDSDSCSSSSSGDAGNGAIMQSALEVRKNSIPELAVPTYQSVCWQLQHKCMHHVCLLTAPMHLRLVGDVSTSLVCQPVWCVNCQPALNPQLQDVSLKLLHFPFFDAGATRTKLCIGCSQQWGCWLPAGAAAESDPVGQQQQHCCSHCRSHTCRQQPETASRHAADV
jgi:hypothetical protein